MPALVPLVCSLIMIFAYGLSENPFGAFAAFVVLAAMFWPVTRFLYGETLVLFRIRKSNPYD